MLPERNRLKKKKDFERIFKKGRGIREDFLLLKLFKNNLEACRFGFVVGQKVSKRAVIRNKIRRRLREVVRKELPNLKPGFDGAWVALKGAELWDFRETEKTVKKILQKAKLVNRAHK